MNPYKILLATALFLNSIVIYADANPAHHSSEHAAPVANMEKFTLNATSQQPLQINQPVQVTLMLRDAAGKPIAESELEIAHTEKVHALIIDPTLTDYHHKHPKPSNKPGEYIFTFTPRTKNNYRIWLDIKPVNGQQAYVIADLAGGNRVNPAVKKILSRHSKVDDYQFDLTFDIKKPKANETMLGSVMVKDSAGKAVTTLEPVMGEFAHIVAFAQDYKTILHIHPMGTSPTSPADRGGPQIDFHIMPAHAGYIKLFTQVQISGQELMVPFGIHIEP